MDGFDPRTADNGHHALTWWCPVLIPAEYVSDLDVRLPSYLTPSHLSTDRWNRKVFAAD